MKRIFALLLVVMMTLAIFAGCEKNNNKADENKNSEEQTVIKIGVDDNYPPMEFINEDGDRVGFDIDLAEAIGDELDMDIEFVSSAWDGIFLALDTEKFDCIISSVSITKDRMDEMDFSDAYLSNSQVIVVKPEDKEKVSEHKDLDGLKVGVQAGTTSDEALKTFMAENEEYDIEVNTYDAIIQTFADLKTGRIDAIVVDIIVAFEYIDRDPDLYAISSVELTNEPIGIAFKKGNDELREKMQGALDTIRKSGKLKEISEKWFDGDYTSNIDTSNLE